MNKNVQNYIIDICLLISFIITFFTGIFKWPGLLDFLNMNPRSFNFYLINKFHDWSGLAMGLFVLIHIMLHWKWIITMTKKIIRGKNNEN
ncbi:DUF4405 domain-containing protein [Candidatus Woesearchaeota archaeon]|nr:DUF4405 domain-containing protein [Candidatus Woesearchaeota archaeon]MCF7900592.1 DUF4405 domain-containing protein [Candidatus Woesearchaeota archaeon]MCF8013408.1 DUF4405 domain-containing protein [Candidatus Woesearchaeota archaeon]